MKFMAPAALLLSLLFTSCSTDFDVTTDWEDITILYGLLDQSDTANYIKVGKAFLDPNTSAYEIAQDPDSLYYDNLDVVLEEYQNSALVKTLTLTKVDGNLEGYVKDTGIFAQAPNILYKTKEKLNSKSTYKVVVTQPDNGKQISATTAIIDDFTIYRPSSQLKINLLPNSFYNVAWLSAADGRIYALTIRFFYREYSFSNPTQYELKYVDWVNFTNVRQEDLTGGDNMDYDVSGDNFYTFLISAIPVDDTKFRMTDHFDFLFSVGGETLDTYNQVTIAQQGLTSGQVLPTYTNVENGLGLVSSRFHKTVSNVPIDIRTMDTIACLSVTHELNFLRSDSTLCP
jgi:hypothetical protein